MEKKKLLDIYCPKCGSETRKAVNAFAAICNSCELRIPLLVMEHILDGKGFKYPEKVN